MRFLIEDDEGGLIEPSTHVMDPSELTEDQREMLELYERPVEGTDISELELSSSPGIRRPGGDIAEPSPRASRIDPDTPVPTAPTKVQKISAVYSASCKVA